MAIKIYATPSEQRLAHKRNNAVYYERHSGTINARHKAYAKTPKGFIVRLYGNMLSRVTGVQQAKYHLYRGKSLLDRQTFYDWSLNSEEFWRLFREYEASGYERKLAPSVDRIDATQGYELGNMEWVTMSENSRRGAISARKKEAR